MGKADICSWLRSLSEWSIAWPEKTNQREEKADYYSPPSPHLTESSLVRPSREVYSSGPNDATSSLTTKVLLAPL
jgi:hypothetical protein